MNKNVFSIIVCLFCVFSTVCAGEFTISSYNCGGLSDHYDYIRAACMQKLIQERYREEPELMARAERVQQIALKILFSEDPVERQWAERVWEEGEYQSFFDSIVESPENLASPNHFWNQKSEEIVSTYKVRPIDLRDEEVKTMLMDHVKDLTGEQSDIESLTQDLTKTRHVMAERIFHHHLKDDIICLQEADYLDSSMFPERYDVVFSETQHSINGVAWNKERFECIDMIGNILGRAFAVRLLDKESDKTVLVASGHLSGCNPFRSVEDSKIGQSDSAKGDYELQTICQLFEDNASDLKLIAMDSNVTATHPRLKILKNFGYRIDDENFLEPTCTNPHQVLNTRIDWIAVKSDSTISTSITNVPVLAVGLNSIQTNISDHKPVAARVRF